MSTMPSEREPRVPDASSERRLMEIRREAETGRVVTARGIRPAGAPFPQASVETGYYGIPLLKEPQWTAEVPLYFFVGGAAGSAAVIATLADWLGNDSELARTARWVAVGGATLSTALLISDLGRPSRFLNMLRVFKPQSPMSVGAWTLVAFATASASAAFAKEAQLRFGTGFPISTIGNLSQFFSAALGLPFHNYTGVLIGATAIPVWNKNIKTLPIHFGMSGVQAGVSVLELLGNTDNRALNSLGIGSAVYESLEGVNLEARSDPTLRPLKRGVSGWVTRVGGMLSGPVPLTLRLIARSSGRRRSRTLRRWAAVCGIAGSVLTRYGWIHAGHASARDWKIPLEVPEASEETATQSRRVSCASGEGSINIEREDVLTRKLAPKAYDSKRNIR